MSDLDRYDVEAMIRDASYSYATRAGIAEVRDDMNNLGRELQRQIDELRDLLAGLTEAMHTLHVPAVPVPQSLRA